MRILTSTSRRFSRTLNYSLPEYRIDASRVRRMREKATPATPRSPEARPAKGL